MLERHMLLSVLVSYIEGKKSAGFISAMVDTDLHPLVSGYSNT
jgi:hypothetical protein